MTKTVEHNVNTRLSTLADSIGKNHLHSKSPLHALRRTRKT